MNLLIRSVAILYGIVFAVGALEGPAIQIDGLLGAFSFLVIALIPEEKKRSNLVFVACITGLVAVCWRGWLLVGQHTDVAEILLQLVILVVGLGILLSAMLRIK